MAESGLKKKIPKIRVFPGGLMVKDPALSLLWLGFDPWPGNFRMPGAAEKKKKKSMNQWWLWFLRERDWTLLSGVCVVGVGYTSPYSCGGVGGTFVIFPIKRLVKEFPMWLSRL